MADHAWNHTSLGLVDEIGPEHRMCLSTCCLAICEYCSIESFHDAKDDRFDSLLVYKALWRVGVENLIIIECVRSTIASRVCSMYLHCVLLNELDELRSLPKTYHHNLDISRRHFYNLHLLFTKLALFLIKRTKSGKDLNIATTIRRRTSTSWCFCLPL